MLMMLATLLAPATGPAVPVRAAAVALQQPAIQLTLNRDAADYTPGEDVGVRVRTREDGYVVVMRVDDNRQLQVLFPLDPGDDAFVKGGKQYEVRSRYASGAFMADDEAGSGMIFAAVSKQPFDFNRFTVDGHWDYGQLRLNDTSSDPEHDLTAIVSVMTNQQRFDYDVVGYSVQNIAAAATTYDDEAGNGYYPGYYDPYYNPSWRCLACGWGYPQPGFNINLGFGYFDPYYDPFLFDPWYYGYGSYGGYGGYGGYWYPGYYPPVVVGGRPTRTRVDVPGFGTRARPRAMPEGGGHVIGPVGRPGTAVPSAPVGHPTFGAPRPRAPQPEPRTPQSQPHVGAPTARPSARPAAPHGGNSGVRARPVPNNIDVGRSPAARGEMMPGRAVPGSQRDVRPVFREPPRASNPAPSVRVAPQRDQRPVYREPPRVEQPPMSRPSSPEVRPSARPAPPRAAPAPAPHGGGARAPAPRPTGGHGHGR